jgi:CheY-like chemotaxis protein
VLKTHFLKGLPLMRGNATQLRQVVMNLIINASEALGEQDGVIRIASSLASGGRNLPDGDYLRLSVSDTGGGITDEHKARIFDPFFSTKFAGRGLGLAVVQGIVRAHGGLIQLDSTAGQGTTLELFFPCFPGTDADRTAVATGETSKMRDDDITVLFVEDEDSLRDAVSKMLVRKGFVVIGAADGSIAINLLRRHPGDIDVVLLDMTLPGTPSREIIAEAQRIRPAVKIVLTSAYSREMVAQSVDSPAVRGFIRKPFQFSELLHLLEETLS